ncbi:MAG: NADH-quinone oxidoreductase subunit C [Myxococcota bacterium]
MSRVDPNSIRARHRDLGVEVADAVTPIGELWIRVPGAQAKALLARLAAEDETAARRWVDLTVIDRGPGRGESRFEVVYRLHSALHQTGLRVHAIVAEADPSIASVTSIWPGAAWPEREAFDLFGIHFKGHPDLRRLLLEPGFDGAPLRKDSIGAGEGAE